MASHCIHVANSIALQPTPSHLTQVRSHLQTDSWQVGSTFLISRLCHVAVSHKQQRARCHRFPAVHSSLADRLPSTNGSFPFQDYLHSLSGSNRPPLSDIVWTAAGAFAAMAGLAWADSFLSPRGLSPVLGSWAAVSCILLAAPSSPSASRRRVITAHAGCSLVGVAALKFLGSSGGWPVKAVALAAAVAFMHFADALHPPAAGLPLMYLDIPRLHSLGGWYVLFPGVLGCLALFLLQDVVLFLKKTFKF